MLLKVDRNPLVACPQPVALAIVVAEAVVVLETVLEHQLCAFLARLPPWCYDAARGLAVLEIFDQAVALWWYQQLDLHYWSG